MDRISFKGQAIDQIDLQGVPHSGFDRSNHNYFTGKLGRIIPSRLDEVYPGDRIKGTPQLVANFEPLAAPLMGSMVLKQEAFFVPLIQVWRHAFKFFTGKNGFNENIPSISPFDIFEVYCENFLGSLYDIGEGNGEFFDHIVGLLNEYYVAVSDDPDVTYYNLHNSFFIDDLRDNISAKFETLLRACFTDRKMLDLVWPILEHVNTFVESQYIKDLSISFNHSAHAAEVKSQIEDFCLKCSQIMIDIHQFFFGPSSLFDYMGWPITLDKQFDVTLTFPLDGSEYTQNVFYKALWYNVTNYGNYTDLKDFIGGLFSKVYLNFLPFKAYYLTWYWNYRDQLLETDILDPEEDEFLGSDITENVVLYCTILRQRCWFKDAYTTALTNTGDGNLLVPTGDSSYSEFTYYDNNDNLINTTDMDQAVAAGATYCQVSNGSYTYKVPMNYLSGAFSDDYGSQSSDGLGFISLDLFDRIKRLRSFIQKKLILGYEVDDVIWSSFMVKMSNVRMHIPELLGRGRDSVDITTLVNNTSTDQQIAGDKTATAWTKGSISEVNYFSEEWGFYLQFATIMPIQSYAGGMQRLYLKKDVFDYMWPEFATMGMDAVYNCELAALGTHLSDEDGLKVFGYQGRYYDLKYRQDEEHGRLLTDLNYLTFSREFDSDNKPRLNYWFVHCWPRLDGFVIESHLEDVFRADCYTAQGWERRLPVPSQFVH